MENPNLSSLSINNNKDGDIIEQWSEACGERHTFARWGNLRAKGKYMLLHKVAQQADDDVSDNGDYVTAYDMIDIDDLKPDMWSVEHVVPRSHINGKGPGRAEDDPVGWIEAHAIANSRRSNYPLYLWPDEDGMLAPSNNLVVVNGETHYVPPLEQRGRLARKWLFIRATYAGSIRPPSRAQIERAAKIVAFAKADPLHPAERRVNEHYRKTFKWANPLLEDESDRFYDSVVWRNRVFGDTPMSSA